MLRLGVQVSTTGGIQQSIDRALALGCNTMQIFARNPRKFRKGFLKKSDIKLFREKREATKITPLVVHTPYTLNLATPKKFFHWVTVKEFSLDLIEADKLGAEFLVTHTGCYKGSTEEEGLRKVVIALRRILQRTEGVETKILLENTAGAGTWLGYTFFHHHYILSELNFTERIAFCLDTAHAWSAGYKINTPAGVEELLEEIERQVGLRRIEVVHLNDTQDDLGSKKDRHYHIGEGKIGEEGFSCIINHPSLKHTVFILETPKKTDLDDLKNLDTVRKLYKNELFSGNR